MTEPGTKRPRRLRRMMVRALIVIALVFAPLVAMLSYGVHAPSWMTKRFENRLNASITAAHVSIGTIDFRLFANGLNPEIQVLGVKISDGSGQLRAVFPEISSELSGTDLLFGRIRPKTMSMHAADLRLNRDAQGTFDLSIGSVETDEGETASVAAIEQNETLADIIFRFETILDTPILSRMTMIEASDIEVNIKDALSGRDWKFHHGVMRFENGQTDLAANMTFQMSNQSGQPAEATFSFSKSKGAAESEFTTRFRGFRTNDVADQVAAFDWLRVLNAPIGGSVSLSIQPDGSFGELFGVLDIGAGQLISGGDIKPVKFTGAKAYLSYDREKEKLTFNQISLNTDAVRIEAEGHAYLSDRIDRSVGAVIGQFRFTKVVIDPKGMFEAPVRFDFGALDMRVRLSPFQVDIGQMVLADNTSKFRLSGVLAADPDGWASSVDLSVDQITRDRVIALWPLTALLNTREWISENIPRGQLDTISAGFRASPGAEPRLSIGFNITETDVRWLKTMPLITGTSGYGVLTDRKLDIVANTGIVTSPTGGDINIAGTVFTIPDVTIIGAPAEIRLKTQSSITAALSLLDHPPFQFISKGGFAPDVAQGSGTVSAEIGLPLIKDVPLDLITFQANADLTAVVSDKLVKGKTLTADKLSVFVDDAGVTVSGDANLGKVPFNGSWIQKFGPSYKGISRIEGQVEISQGFLDEFDIALPKDTIAGQGRGTVTLDLVTGQAPKFTLVSDLNRVLLRIASLGYAKPKNVTGRLDVRGTLGTPARIDEIKIKTRGLEAAGSVILNKNGTLNVARFSGVNVDGWMKAGVEIRPGADNTTDFTLTGGVIDLRNSRFSDAKTSEGGSRIKIKDSKVIVSNGITIRGVSGQLNTTGGLSGSFSGRVNGGTSIVGTLATTPQGVGVRFTSEDAGAVMRDAGIFTKASGGRMDMILTPSEKTGEYDGKMEVQQTRVRNASTLAEILSAISVLGLIEQLDGEGIAFSTVSAQFHLTPNGVSLTQSSAVGVSLGLTMQGTYDFEKSALNMQGVVTPIYLLNGLLEQTKVFGGLFGKQKGEGLFGFNYTMKGTVEAPKVLVNPLSILTPGLFREIFRVPIPKAPE